MGASETPFWVPSGAGVENLYKLKFFRGFLTSKSAILKLTLGKNGLKTIFSLKSTAAISILKSLYILKKTVENLPQ
jgi:hypothetical protein